MFPYNTAALLSMCILQGAHVRSQEGPPKVVMVGNTSVTVTKRSRDYHACITGQAGTWDCGSTEAIAIERLKLTWPKEF